MIQKCIEVVPAEKIQFIVDAFSGQVHTLATHPYGCRVLQRILEHCQPHQKDPMLAELLRTSQSLVQDQYGNYVIQHVLQHGTPKARFSIVNKMQGHVLQWSRHKFASNVCERACQFGTPEQRAWIIAEITTPNPADNVAPLVLMIKDQYANYVVKKILDLATDAQRDKLLQLIRSLAPMLNRAPYAKHVLAYVDASGK